MEMARWLFELKPQRIILSLKGSNTYPVFQLRGEPGQCSSVSYLKNKNKQNTDFFLEKSVTIHNLWNFNSNDKNWRGTLLVSAISFEKKKFAKLVQTPKSTRGTWNADGRAIIVKVTILTTATTTSTSLEKKKNLYVFARSSELIQGHQNCFSWEDWTEIFQI